MIQSQLTPERIAADEKSGFWPNRTLLDYIDEYAPRQLDKVAITDLNNMTGQATTLSYRQLLRLTNRIALGLMDLGVGRGDVVAFQLPNWWQFIALHLACSRIGAVTNPMMPIFRHRELTFMLGLAESKVLIAPNVFRGFDHAQMMREIKADLPALKHIFAIGGEGGMSFEKHFLERRWEDEQDCKAIFAERQLRPNDVTQLLYTSGTTGEPKGALHTSNTLLSNLCELIKRLKLTGDQVFFMPSPLAHQTGYAIGMVIPLMLGGKLVLQDVWDAGVGLQRIQDEGVNFTMASPPFLADLAGHPGVDTYDISSLKIFVAGGAPIPRALVHTATERLKANIVSGWGMTENLLVTTTCLGDLPEKVFNTDGVPVPGMALRVVDANGKVLGPDQEGDLQSRGPSHFVGYLKRPEMYGMDAEGWFSTGDIATLDADGYVRITGRGKDILIRGGENVPVIEIEQLLYQHKAIQAAAVVGVPDPRLGERGVAYVILKSEQDFTLDEMQRFLAENRMTKNYWPEYLQVVNEFPRTPSGKIQKFKLREMAKTEIKIN